MILHLFLALATACSPVFADYQLDFAVNGSFETDANRDGEPDNWKPARFRSPAITTWDRGVAHTGKASVCVADSKSPADHAWEANTGRWVQADQHPAQAGKRYTVHGWIRTELTAGRATLTLAWFGGGKWLHEDSAPAVTGTTPWVERTLTATAPARTDKVAVYLILNRGKGKAWFDDVSLVQGDRCPGGFLPVDLRGVCTTGFRDEVAGDGKGGWTDQGPNDLGTVPVGRHVWRGIPFDVLDPATNGGKSCVALRGHGRHDMPPTVTIPVGRRCDVIYFLHACAWAGPPGTLVATYAVAYADGTTVEVPLHSGREILDWWGMRDTKQCAAGWRGRNAEHHDIGLGIYPWSNPRPQVPVREVRFESRSGDALPLLVAVTTGRGPAVLQKEPVQLAFTDTAGWYPWTFDLTDPTVKELDLSFLLDPPAGKHGFVRVGGDGHFHFQDGARVRFFGTDLGGSSCCPDKRTAEVTAARLARFGVNLVRLHAVDSRWVGFIAYDKGNSRALNPAALDRYDYLVAQLKKQGIYVYFDLLDYRQFLPGDGVRDAEMLHTHWEHSIKGASIFDRRMIALQKEYATQLLTHRNPYTGLRYVDEPALILQEITNENSLFYLNNTRLLLPSYLDDLTRRWNEWLARRYPTRVELAAAWTDSAGRSVLSPGEDPRARTVAFPVRYLYTDLRRPLPAPQVTQPRLDAGQRFLYETEVAYYDEMIRHLRGLGLKCPITGTNQDFSAASNFANARCDVMTRNNYWCHPNVHSKPMRFSNDALVRSDLTRRANLISNIASSAVSGKPLISPEFNAPWPNEWRAECLPLMVCYGSLQDWDGMLYFAYQPDPRRGAPLSSFGNQSDPVRWGQMPFAALVFHRGAVAPAKQSIDIAWARAETFRTRPRRSDDPNSPYHVLPFLSRVRNVYFDSVYRGEADLVIAGGAPSQRAFAAAGAVVSAAEWRRRHPSTGVYRSDTGELTLDTTKGVFTAVTPTAVVATGFLGILDRLVLGPVELECATPFASVSLVSLDGVPLTRSRRLLLTAVARAENTGQALVSRPPRSRATPEPVLDADTGAVLRQGQQALAEPGRAPVLAEPVDARLTLRTRAPLVANPLSPRAERRPPLVVQHIGGRLVVQTAAAHSPWILLTSPKPASATR